MCACLCTFQSVCVFAFSSCLVTLTQSHSHSPYTHSFPSFPLLFSLFLSLFFQPFPDTFRDHLPLLAVQTVICNHLVTKENINRDMNITTMQVGDNRAFLRQGNAKSVFVFYISVSFVRVLVPSPLSSFLFVSPSHSCPHSFSLSFRPFSLRIIYPH